MGQAEWDGILVGLITPFNVKKNLCVPSLLFIFFPSSPLPYLPSLSVAVTVLKKTTNQSSVHSISFSLPAFFFSPLPSYSPSATPFSLHPICPSSPQPLSTHFLELECGALWETDACLTGLVVQHGLSSETLLILRVWVGGGCTIWADELVYCTHRALTNKHKRMPNFFSKEEEEED